MKNNQEFINKGKFVCVKCARQIMNERAKGQEKPRFNFSMTCNHEFDHIDEAIRMGWTATSVRVHDTFAVFSEINQATIWTLDELITINPELKKYKRRLWYFNTLSRGEAFYKINEDESPRVIEEKLMIVADAKGSRNPKSDKNGGDTEIYNLVKDSLRNRKDDDSPSNDKIEEIIVNINDVSYGRGVNVKKNTRQQLHIDVVKIVKEHFKFK